MIKKTLILTLFLTSSPLWAKPPHLPTDGPSKPLERGQEMIGYLELDASQEALFHALVEAKKSVYALRKDGRGHKRQLLVGYASGELSKRQVRQKVKTVQIDAMNTHQNVLNAHLDFVASLDASQREKLSERISARPDKSQSKDHHPKARAGLEKRVDRLSLDEEQMALFESFQSTIDELGAFKKEWHQIRKENVELFLNGEMSEDEVQIQFHSHHEELADIQNDTVEAMFALVDGLTEAQVTQLLSKPSGGERPQRSGRPSPARR